MKCTGKPLTGFCQEGKDAYLRALTVGRWPLADF